MKSFVALPRRLTWLNVPAALLITLLQRTPVLKVAAAAEGWAGASRAGAVLRSAFATVASLGAVQAVAGATSFVITTPSPIAASVGTPITPVAFTYSGTPAPAASWRITGSLPPGLTFIPAATASGIVNANTPRITGTPTQAGTFTVRVQGYNDINGIGETNNEQVPIVFNVAGAAAVAPAFTQQPSSQSVSSGSSVTFTVAVTGTPTPTLQWRRNGSDLGGATNASLTLHDVQAAQAGDYTVVATNSAGTLTSAIATLAVVSVDPNARLTNLSVRTALAASQTLIVGVVVNDGTREILVRAAGPALAAFGLTTAMADPQLELFSGSTSVFSNNDWPAALAPTFTSVGAFGFQTGSKDAAFMRPMVGAYSIQARGPSAGVVLVEAYDTGAPTAARMINVSARNRVGTGDDILIAGFTVMGAGPKRLLIRAVGPTLNAAFGITGVLIDPKLEIYNSASVKMTENDNWDAALGPTFASLGAFALTANSRDSALLAVLPPGSYTAQVRGADGGTGEALIEIYEVR